MKSPLTKPFFMFSRIIIGAVVGLGGLFGQARADSSGSFSAGETIPLDLKMAQRISLHLKGATPSSAIAAVADQGHFQWYLMLFPLGPSQPQPPPPPRDFDVVDASLLKTLLHLEAAYGLSWNKEYGEDRVMFGKSESSTPFEVRQMQAANPAVPPICETGPIGVVAREIVRDRFVDPVARDPALPNSVAPEPPQNNVQLALAVVAEPRVTVLSMPSEPDIETMVDDQGNALWTPGQFGSRTLDYASGNDEDTTFNLRLRTVAGIREITTLKGSVLLHVVTASRRYEWLNLDRPGQRTEIMGGLRVTLGALQEDATHPMQEALIDISRTGMSPRDWTARSSLIGHGSHIAIFDKAGNLLTDPFRWYDVTGGLNLQMMVTVGKTKTGTPVGNAYRMVWDFPMSEGDVRAPFAFSHLAMPPD